MRNSFYRKKTVWVFAFFVFLGLVVVSRDLLLARGAEFYVSRLVKQNGWQVEAVSSERNSTLIQGFRSQSSYGAIHLEEVRVLWHLSLFPLELQPHIQIRAPSINLTHLSEQTSLSYELLGLMIGGGVFKPRVLIKEGRVALPYCNEAFAFSFQPGVFANEIGVFQLQTEGEGQDVVRIEITKEADRLLGKGEIFKQRIASLLPWAYWIQGKQPIEKDYLEGEISAVVEGAIGTDGVIGEVSAQLAIEDLDVHTSLSEYAIQATRLQGTVFFSPSLSTPIWKQLELFLTFEGTSVVTGQDQEAFGFRDSLGELRIHPEEDPYVRALGTAVSKGKAIPFEIEGKGELLDDGAYWMQSAVHFFLEDKEPTLAISFCQNKDEEGTVQAEFHQIVQEVYDIVQSLHPAWLPYIMEGGEIGGKVFCHLVQEEIRRLEFSDCLAKNLMFTLPSQSLVGRAEEITFQGVLEKGDLGVLECRSSLAEVHKGNVSFKGFKWEQIASKILVEEGLVMPSYIEGVYRGIKTELQVLGPSADSLLHIECGAYAKDILQSLFQEKAEGREGDNPVFLALDLKSEGDRSCFLATARFISEKGAEDLEIEGSFRKTLTRKVSDLSAPWDFSSLQGSFEMETLSEQTFLPYIGSFFKGRQLRGKGQVRGFFDDRGVKIALSSGECTIRDGERSFSCKMSEDDPVRFSYSLAKNEWEGVFPIQSGLFKDSFSAFSLELLQSVFFYKEGKFWSDSWRIGQEGLQASGQIYIDEASIRLSTDSFRARVEALAPFLQGQLQGFSLQGWQGVLIQEEKGICVNVDRSQEAPSISWSLAAQLESASAFFGRGGAIDVRRALVQADSNGRISLDQVEADYTFRGFSCALALAPFEYRRGEKASFCLTAKKGKEELSSIAGDLDVDGRGSTAQISFSKVMILGMPWEIEPLVLSQGKELAPLSFTGTVRLDAVFGKEELRCLVPEFLLDCRGDYLIQGTCFPVESAWKFSLVCENGSYKKTPLGRVKAQVRSIGDILELVSCEVGPYSFQMKMALEEREWKILSFKGSKEGGQLSAEGSYFPSSGEIRIQSFASSFATKEVEIKMQGALTCSTATLQGAGFLSAQVLLEAPCTLDVRSAKEISFSFDANKGVQLEKSRWDCYVGKAKEKAVSGSIGASQYFFDQEELFLREGCFILSKGGIDLLPKTFSSFLMGKELKIQAEAHVAQGQVRVVGSLPDRTCKFGEGEIELKEAQFFLEQSPEKTGVDISCQAVWKKSPLWVHARTTLGKQAPVVYLSLKEDPNKSGLVLQFISTKQGDWFLERAKGSLRGLNVQIQKKEEPSSKGFIYDAAIQADLQKAQVYFPEKISQIIQKWGLGAGYHYQGVLELGPNFVLESFQGEIRGEQFTCFGQTLASFRAQAALKGEKGVIKDLLVEDPAGYLSVKSLDLIYNPMTEAWVMTAPLIHAKNVYPSFVTRGVKEGMILTNMSLYYVEGCLGKEDSFEASGAAHFSTPIRKEFSLWDVPISLVKDLGLDPGVFTPVTGEVDLMLKNGRFYFNGFRNVYSEGERSQFFLAPSDEGAYLSLKGDWHLDLQVKQKVMWKMGESFTLSVRGTVDKPKYNVKFKK